MKYNRSPLSLREGKMYIDGVQVMDGISCEIHFTPEVWQGKQLGDKSASSRWLGYTISGTISRYRSTNWLETVVKQYTQSGVTPEFTIMGQVTDKNSDWYASYGQKTVTAVGVVLTGDIQLLNMDVNGDVWTDSIGFNAKDIV